MAKKAKRFWTGSPDGYGQPDDDQVEGCLSPDEDGHVYVQKPADDQTPRRAERASTKDRAKKPRKS
jgi:hypothetical protein